MELLCNHYMNVHRKHCDMTKLSEFNKPVCAVLDVSTSFRYTKSIEYLCYENSNFFHPNITRRILQIICDENRIICFASWKVNKYLIEGFIGMQLSPHIIPPVKCFIIAKRHYSIKILVFNDDGEIFSSFIGGSRTHYFSFKKQ